MDKKDDNKKPSKKDKKKDKKDKKDKKKKVVKKKSDDKISQSQIVNIKIGDISKPKTRTRTRRKAAPKAAPPPPQIQRQLQYLPSLAGQAPMIPPPLTPAPTPPPAPPRPPPPAPAPAPAPAPRPPAPAAEPIRTGDFFSDTSGRSVFGSSFDLASATPDDFSSINRSFVRPTLTRAFNRPRSDSTVSALTEPTYADFDNFSEFDNTPNSRFGATIDFDEANTRTGMTDVDEPDPSIAGDITFLSDRTFEIEAPPSAITEELGASAAFESMAQPSQVPITEEIGSISTTQPPPPPSLSDDESTIPPPPYPSDDESTIPPPPYQSDDESTLPPPKSENPFLEELKSKLSVPDYGFGNFGLISSNVPMSQPPLGLQPDIVPKDLVLSSQKPKELKIPKPASDAAEERPATEPITEVSAIIEPVITTPDKGDVRPEDEATGGGGGGVPPFDFYAAMKDPVQQDLIFNRYILERALYKKKLDGGVAGMRDAIEKYNLVNSTGNPLDTAEFGRKYNAWLSKGDRQKEIDKLDSEALKAAAKKARKKAKKQFSGEAAEK